MGSYLAVACLLALASFTLYPLPAGTSGPGITYGVLPRTDILGFVADVRKNGGQAIFQIVANVVFFLPLGFGIGLGLRKGLLRAVVVGLLTSLLIEVTQLTGIFGLYRYAYRCFDVDDLLWNTTGAFIGWLLAALVARALPEPEMALEEPMRRPSFMRRLVFHVVRATMLYVSVARVPILLPVLPVFYLFARRMPYDFLLTRTTSRQG